MKYLLGSGYFNNPCAAVPCPEMARAWLGTISMHANPLPEKVVVVSAGGDYPIPFQPGLTPIHCRGDIGNLSHKVSGHKNHDWAGWMPPVVITAMIAYNEELDFVFQEQDCLAFGPYIERMYSDMGDGQMAIGRPLQQMGMPATQSLFIVKHAYIWKFVRDYLTLGGDDNDANQGEKKFARLRANNPADVRVLTFGSDRDRPIPWDEPVISAQQWSREEFETAKAKGLIP